MNQQLNINPSPENKTVEVVQRKGLDERPELDLIIEGSINTPAIIYSAWKKDIDELKPVARVDSNSVKLAWDLHSPTMKRVGGSIKTSALLDKLGIDTETGMSKKALPKSEFIAFIKRFRAYFQSEDEYKKVIDSLSVVESKTIVKTREEQGKSGSFNNQYQRDVKSDTKLPEFTLNIPLIVGGDSVPLSLAVELSSTTDSGAYLSLDAQFLPREFEAHCRNLIADAVKIFQENNVPVIYT